MVVKMGPATIYGHEKGIMIYAWYVGLVRGGSSQAQPRDV